MSDQRPNRTIVRERSGNGGILFVLGAIVVAITVLLWYVVGGGTMGSADKSVTKTNVTIEAPATAAPAPATAAPAPAASAPAPAVPAAPASPTAPAKNP